MANTNADSVFLKLQEESRMNAFFAKENLPKSLADAKSKLSDLKNIVERHSISDVEMANIEKEIAEIGRINSQLVEKSYNTKNGDANLGLFRQQAAIVSSKKDAMVSKLNSVMEEEARLQSTLQERIKNGTKSTKMLIGDDFQKYVSELRTKSVQFKLQKSELASMTTELGVLSRTKQVTNFA